MPTYAPRWLARMLPTKMRQRVVTRQDMWRYGHAIQAKYDAAQTTVENERWWANADSLGPNAATNSWTRRKIRQRARYECTENHCYAHGIIHKKVTDVVGKGPRLQVLANETVSQLVEDAWNFHLRKVLRLASKLRTYASANYVDGEAFCQFTTNRGLKSDFTLDLRLSEADLWESPEADYKVSLDSSSEADGIKYDPDGNPVSYSRSNQHPGEMTFRHEYSTIPADQVVHWYRAVRPDQRRGVSQMAPALPLFAQHRRYLLAVLAAAETAADHAAVLETDSAAFNQMEDFVPDTPEAGVNDSWHIPITRRAMVSLPLGWKLNQLRAEQPTTAFNEFEKSIIRQLSQCVSMPENIAIGSSEKSNFASARLDFILYHAANDVEREDLEIVFLERVFDEFLRELGEMFPLIAIQNEIPHIWTWPSRPPVDEQKAAAAKQILWDMGLWTDEDELAQTQRDPKAHYDRLRRQIEIRREMGAPLPAAAARPASDANQRLEEVEEAVAV